VWTPVLKKIDSDYERWANLNPTLNMRKNIDQIVAGSRSQYLAQVNGMPAAVTKHILKAQKEFINDSKSSMISRDTLLAPRELGGIGMLDLEARNEALLMLKAASLAEDNPQKRAHWASLALHGLSQHTVKATSVAEEAKTNLMVQTIKVNQRDPPALHKTLVKCVYKYGVNFATIHPSKEVQKEMPLWHHPGEDPQKRQDNNGKKAKCLRGKHAAITIGDGLEIAQRLNDPLHNPRALCACDRCDDDRMKGCLNPHTCATAAASCLRQILPQWVPRLGLREAIQYSSTPRSRRGLRTLLTTGGHYQPRSRPPCDDSPRRRTKRTRGLTGPPANSSSTGPRSRNDLHCRGSACTTA
jgi:hypothetical protein